MVHHKVRGFSSVFEKGKRSLQQRPCSFAIYRGQNDQTWMNFDSADQAPEVSGIFGNKDPILRDAPFQDAIVWLAAPANVQWMDGVVAAGRIEPRCQVWRQALINEQLHAASAQGRPPGRPMSGCVRA